MPRREVSVFFMAGKVIMPIFGTLLRIESSIHNADKDFHHSGATAIRVFRHMQIVLFYTYTASSDKL